ncbi:hypothetical protein AGMMS49944_08190 [Spirochaetia bacterium]|nr:hypothetical protein AGMMS49944_08190 [Spirochaetia bacterium]
MATRIYNDWYGAYPDEIKCAANVEYVLKACDKYVVNKYDADGDTMAGPLTAPYFNATSTKEAKQDIKPFEDSALDIIKDLNIVSYNFKTDDKGEPQIGFIAEETTPLLSGKDQKSMKINTTIGLLLKSIQELTAEVEQLKKQTKP